MENRVKIKDEAAKFIIKKFDLNELLDDTLWVKLCSLKADEVMNPAEDVRITKGTIGNINIFVISYGWFDTESMKVYITHSDGNTSLFRARITIHPVRGGAYDGFPKNWDLDLFPGNDAFGLANDEDRMRDLKKAITRLLEEADDKHVNILY